MKLKNLKVGLAITGSFCNFSKVEKIIDDLKAAEVELILPIVSEIVANETTRFYENKEFLELLKNKTGNDVIDSIVKAEPVGPKNLVDVIVISPCTGNTIAKLATGISDTAVTMAVKSHIRNNKPVVIALSTNDGLGQNFKNIGELLNTKNFYFVPFGQDNSKDKPKSLTFQKELIVDTIDSALKNIQIQPILFK